MPVIHRAHVAEPTLAKQTVEVEALGGEVVVRGLLLVERLAVTSRLVALRQKAPKPTEPPAEQAGPYDPQHDINTVIPMLLAIAVVDAEGEPLWTESQWQAFGGRHQAQALALFNVAWDLAGLNEKALEKN